VRVLELMSSSLFAPQQAVFFGPQTTISTYKGLQYLGITMIVVTQLTWVIWFPMWGGMILPASAGADEMSYYSAEYTAAEIEEGKHLNASKFVSPFSLVYYQYNCCCCCCHWF
jgi:hypothetical protein